jgi:hypothetical protein
MCYSKPFKSESLFAMSGAADGPGRRTAMNFPLRSVFLRLLTEVPLLSVGAVCVLCATLGPAPPAQAEPKRNVVGYSSEWSLRPGDTVEFHVNVVGSGTYEADLVRVVNGDSLSR